MTQQAFSNEVNQNLMNNGNDGCIEIRRPSTNDIRGIIAVVRSCEPYLTPHHSYVYWKDIHCYRDTCAVAECSGEIVGWCSVFPISGRSYFLHQLGVAPMFRRARLAEALVTYLLNKLSEESAGFELEFTIDQRNAAARNLFHAVADRAGMLLLKAPAAVRLLEEDCHEELHVMTPLRCPAQQELSFDVAAVDGLASV